MKTKALIYHAFVTSTRVFNAIQGISYWQIAYKEFDEIENINTSFVNESKGKVKTCMATMIVMSIFFDVIIWRRRNFARYIVYFELVFLFIHGFVPFNYGKVTT